MLTRLRDERVRDCATLVAVALLAVAAVQPFQDTPFVDDWAYAWSVEQLLREGRLELLDFSANLNVAQLLWGWLFSIPFGFSFTALRWSTWTLAAAAVCGAYLLLRRLEVGRRPALLGAATLAVYPPFAILSATFMTDVPFVSATVLGSYAMISAVRARSTAWLVAAAILAAIAAATRAVGIVMPLAMCATLLCSHDPWGRKRGRWVVALLPLAVFATLTYWSVAHTRHVADLTWINNGTTQRLSQLRFAVALLPAMLVETFVLLTAWLGLALVPLALGCVRRETARQTLATAAGIGCVLAALHVFGVRYTLPFEINATWRADGLGFAPLLVPFYAGAAVPAWIPWAALSVAVVSVSVMAPVVFRRRSLGAGERFLIWMTAGHAGLMALIWLIHDRYVLVLIPLAAALLLSAQPRLKVPAVVAGLALFALISAAGISDHLHYNRALWSAVGALDRMGLPARDVDAGYIVNGWRQYAHPDQAPQRPDGEVNVPWVNGSAELPYAVGNTVPDGWTALESFPYRRLMGPGGAVYTLRRDAMSTQLRRGEPERSR
jgi:4-amino-4-deoxy-L-arabinose transferase-like glycosyltransferase